MTTTKKRLAIAKTIYPLDYNKNNPMEGFNDWAQYIHSEVRKMEYTGEAVMRRYNHEIANSLINMARLANEAREQVK